MERRTDYPLWLTIEEAAKMLRVHKNTLYDKANQDKLPIVRIGTTVRIDRDALFRINR